MSAIDDSHRGNRAAPSLADHLETGELCRGCRAELAPPQDGAPRRPASSWPKTGPRLRSVIAAFVAVMALATGLALVAPSFLGEGVEPYVASKGVPAAQALIRSDGRSRIWDGRSPLHAGDTVALRAGCEEFAHVAVVTSSGDGWSRLFDGACPTGGDPLPFTLVMDDNPGNERIAVVFSGARLDDDALHSTADHRDRTNEAWVIELVLPKGVSP